MKAVVGIDVDGVLGDAISAIKPLVLRDTGQLVTKDDYTHWNYLVPIVGSVSKMLALMDEAWNSGLVQPEENDLRKSFQTLRKADYRIMIITQRTHGSHAAVTQWIQDQKLPYDDLIFLGEGDKLNFPLHALVDDNPSIVQKARHHADKLVMLRDQPWNREVEDVPRNVYRVKSLSHATEFILKNLS